MLNIFLEFIIKQRPLVILCGVLLLAMGFIAWKNLPIDAYPDVTNEQVMILTESEGLTPAEVERLITYPIEVEMSGLPDVTGVRSLSKTGLSQVIVGFKDDVDTYFARQLVFERLAQVRHELPEGVQPELGPISTGLGEIYQYSLEAGYFCAEHTDQWSQAAGPCRRCEQPMQKAEHGLMDLRTLQDWVVSPQLRRLEGVTEINSFGGYVKQYHVICEPELLLKYGITTDDVVAALEANNANASGGFIERDWEQINVLSRGLAQGISDLEQITLKAQSGTPVYLKDVARIEIGQQTRNGAATKDGRGETVIGMVVMLKGSNSKDVVDRVRAQIPEIQKSLPPGVRIIPFYDRTSLIDACIQTVTSALGQGVLLIILLLFLVLLDIRAALIVALSLPLTAAATFLLMDRQQLTGNLMSLGGLAIAIGMIVDASIIVIENIVRHMGDPAHANKSRLAITLEAVHEVARPVIFSIFIIVVVFVPLFTLESMEGKMFKPLALTICMAMLSSLAVALTIVPVLGSLVIKRAAARERQSVLLRLLHRLYLPLLALVLRRRGLTILLAAIALAAAFSVLPRIGTEFLPPLNEGALAINVVRLPTAGLKGSVLQVSEIEKRLLERFPEIETVVSKTGRAEIAEDPMGPEQNDVFVMLRPRYEQTFGRSREELVGAVSRELAAFPGIRPAFSQSIALRVNELVSGIKSDVALKIFGDDLELLRQTAEQIAPVVAAIDGAVDVKIEQVSGFSQIELVMNRQALARHKINIDDVNRLVRTAIGGSVPTTVFEGQRRFDVQVRFPLNARADIEAIEQLLIRSPQGYNVPLGEVATIQEIDAPAQISREDSTRRLIVECNVRGRDIGGFVEEAKASLAAIEGSLPEGYRLTWGGQFENQQRAAARLRVAVPAAIALIFLMLFTSLKSAKSALLVLLNLPFALVGGVLALFLLDINMSVAASVGFIALLGVAVEDGLVLVTFFEQLRARGTSVCDAVVEGCRLRVLSVMVTSLTTLVGLLPMLYATGAGSEIQKPLVAVIFGGLISSLTLTLILLPVLYVIFNRETKTSI